MPVTILTHVKGIINMMGRLLTIPRFWGPLLTIVFTGVYHAGVMQGWYEPTLIGVCVFVVAGALVSGLRGGLLAALWGSVYAIYVMLPSTRLIQVIGGLFIIGAGAGYVTRNLRAALAEARQARFEAEKSAEVAKAALERAERNEAAAQALEALNGNILRIRQARETILNTLKNHPLDEDTRTEMRQALHILNNLELATAGWQAYDKLKRKHQQGMTEGEGDVHNP